MEALGVAANVIAVVDISVKVVQLCSEYAKEAKNAKVEIQELRQEVENLQVTAKKVQELIESPKGTRLKASQNLLHQIKECQSILSEIDRKLQPATKHGFWRRGVFRSLNWPFQSGEVRGIVGRLSRSSISISHILQVDQTALLLDADTKLDNTDSKLSEAVTKLNKVDISQIISKLPVAAGATYNSQAEQDNSICLETTRSELLRDIDDWLENTNTETIFWLQGMAGTGKSTIARTVATSWDDKNYLGASFFFKRGGGDRGNLSCFYTTIASQLAICNQDLASSIKSAVDQDPSLMSKMAEEQFDKLTLQPVLKLQSAKTKTIAIVIDALDECDGDDGIRRLINILTRTKDVSNVRMKVFITSRPELHIRLGFRAVSGSYQDFVLHEIPEDIIKRDINEFFTHKLERIRQDYNLVVEDDRQLPDVWPGPERIAVLVEKAVPLFIFAATVCRFISQRRSASPEIQLRKVLTFDTKSHESKMNATYLPSLEQQLEDLSLREQDEVIDDFQQIVGTIVLLEAPLTVSALSRIIDVPEESIYNRLDILHSVLNCPKTSESPIRMLHLSFRDFLLDPEKKGINRFWVDEKQSHGRIATGCLRILKSSLKEDLCSLKAPGTTRSAVTLSQIASHISPDLEYACRYWVKHLRKAPLPTNSSEHILAFLECYLLHFLECLSLIGRLSEIYDMLAELEAIEKENECSRLCELLVDLRRFLRMNFTIVDQYPLQLYSSLRYTIPPTSPMYTILTSSTPEWMSKFPGSLGGWDPRQNTLEGHEALILAAAFSTDSTHIVSLSEDGNIRVWRLDTGECIREIWTGGAPFDLGIDKYIAMTTEPMWICLRDRHKLYIWHGETAQLVGHYPLFKDTSPFARESPKPCFSECAQYCAFIDASSHVIILKLESGSPPQRLYVDDSRTTSDASSFVFSKNSKFLSLYLCTGRDESLVWDIETGACIKHYTTISSPKMEARDGLNICYVNSTFICADSSLLVALVPRDTSSVILVQALPSRDLIQSLYGHESDIRTTKFLKDGTILGSSCKAGEIRTWNIKTGQCLTKFIPFDFTVDVEISPCYQIACSIFRTKSIGVVSNSSNELSTVADHGEGFLEYLWLSADKTQVAAVFDSGMIMIWDIRTGDCIFHLDQEYCEQRKSQAINMTPNFDYILLPTGDTTVVCPSTRVRYEEYNVQILKTFSSSMNGRSDIVARSFCYTTTHKYGVTISPNNRLIALVYRDTVCISNLDTNVTMYTIRNFDGTQYLMFSPDSRLLAILSDELNSTQPYDKSLLSIFDIEAAEMIKSIELPARFTKIIDISFGSDLVVLVHRGDNVGGYVHVINITTQAVSHGFSAWVMVTFSSFNSDYTIFAGQPANGIVELSSVSTGKVITRLRTHIFLARLELAADSDFLSTNIGDIQLDYQKDLPSLNECKRIGLGLNEDQSWILWNGNKVFWLPPAIQPMNELDSGTFFEVFKSTVIITGPRGEVRFFIFDIESLMEATSLLGTP